jgi:hypothetical protein
MMQCPVTRQACENPFLCKGGCIRQKIQKTKNAIMGDKPTAKQTRQNLKGRKMQDGSILTKIGWK